MHLLQEYIIRGLSHHKIREIPELRVGDELILTPEPANPYDPEAIKITHKDSNLQIGYIPREVTYMVHPLLLTPHTAILSYFDLSNKWPRATVGIYGDGLPVPTQVEPDSIPEL